MKVINFKMRNAAKMLVPALAAVVMVSCGGGNSNKQSGNATSETKTEVKAAQSDVVISKTSKVGDYTAGALAKMKSLGKTKKDKQIVTAGGSSDWTIYTVYTFENGQCIDKSEYTFCKKDINKELFAAKCSLAKEVNETDLWAYHSYGSDSGDWQSWYDSAKKIENLGNKVVE
jgi:hypothetical protein